MYAQKKSIENIYIVRERDRQRFRELLAVLALGIPIAVFLLFFTWQNLEVIRLGHEATRLQRSRKEIEDSNKALQLELDRLTSLQAVEEKATALGFQPTEPRNVVTLVASSERATGGEPVVTPIDRAIRNPQSAVPAARPPRRPPIAARPSPEPTR